MFVGYSFSAVGFVCCNFLIWLSSLYSKFACRSTFKFSCMEFGALNHSYPLLFIEGGKNEAKIAQRNISWYVLIYANSDVHQISRSRTFSSYGVHQEIAQQFWIAQEDRNKRMWLMQCMSSRETNENVKKDCEILCMLFLASVWTCKKLPFL